MKAASGNRFAVLIQLGAILAILVIYFARLWRIALGMFSDPDARRFVIGVLVAFLPAVIIGLIAGSYIKAYLFNPWVVCFSLIVGGAVLLWVDRLDLQPRYHDATAFSLPMYLGIGIAQCAAMIPASRARGRASCRRCCSAPTSGRPRNFRSSSPSPPWWARSPMISTRTARR